MVSESPSALETGAAAVSAFSRPCSFHASPGGCKKGARCTFSHNVSRGGDQLQHDSASPAANPPFFAVERDVDTSARDSGSQTSAEESGRPCSFHASSGGCKNGARCTFNHSHFQQIPVFPAITSEAPVERNMDVVAHINGAPFAVATMGRPCSFHTSPGGCKKGDRCTYSHIEPKGSSADATCLNSPSSAAATAVSGSGNLESCV
jgi:hypothetical protein